MSVLLFACDKQIDKPINYQNNDNLVIQAILTSDTSYQEIYISELWDTDSFDIIFGKTGAQVYVYRAILSLTNGDTIGYDTTFFKEKSNDRGIYYTDSFDFEYTNYYLEVQYDNYSYKAVDKAPRFNHDPVNFNYISSLTFDYPSNPALRDSLYRITNMDNTIGPPVLYRIKLDWSNLESYENMSYESTHAEVIGYLFKTMDANQLFGANARAEEILIPKGTKYSIESYSISQAHETYLRGIASETRWRGGLYDLQAGNARTNIKGGAFGFFAVSEKVTVNGVFE